MASGFCARCSRLLEQIRTWLTRFCKDVEQRARGVFRELCQCGCFRSAPEKRLLRRMTEELTPVQLLGKGTATVDFHCLWSPIMWTIKHTDRLPLLFLNFCVRITKSGKVWNEIISQAYTVCEMLIICFLSDAETQLFNQETLQALSRLATSENTEDQMMAALCYLHLSLNCE